MATPFAVRRSGSLLLRALAVGGLAAAAWFVCGGVAAAGEDHSDEAPTPLDAVNVALGEQQSATTDLLLADAVRQYAGSFTPVTAAPQPFESQAVEAVDFHPFTAAVHPLVVVPAPVPVEAAGDLCSYAHPADAYPSWTYPDVDAAVESDFGSGSYSGSSSGSYSDSESDSYGYSGGYADGYGYSGGASNTMPAPLYEAKVAAKAAAREAAEVSAAPPASVVEVIAQARADVPVPPFAAAQPVPDSPSAQAAEVVWEVPEPSTPAPAPKQAPAPSSPTASSSSGADSGGGHRGGLIASFAGRSDSKPLTALSVERPDDGRSPGSIPGLPSTSPD
ncbi:hypothetical protein AB0G02_21580 [Actinosynnema sp. NPDC023658]|uniref:hypothetical protein n=1 Tax=Actinosynnema sp. NPDC023658 TaxID=3155465 RepID=UPI0033F21510